MNSLAINLPDGPLGNWRLGYSKGGERGGMKKPSPARSEGTTPRFLPAEPTAETRVTGSPRPCPGVHCPVYTKSTSQSSKSLLQHCHWAETQNPSSRKPNLVIKENAPVWPRVLCFSNVGPALHLKTISVIHYIKRLMEETKGLIRERHTILSLEELVLQGFSNI